MKKLLLLLTATFWHFTAYADYEPTLLAELVDKADLIMYGELTTLHSTTVLAKPLRVLKGNFAIGSITIEKFKNWTCASRYAVYQPGQRAVFFLKSSGAHNRFLVLGAANEGEMPVVNNKVYYSQQYLPIDKSPRSFKVPGGVVNGYVYDIGVFQQAVGFYLGNRPRVLNLIGQNQNRVDTMSNPVLLRLVQENRAQQGQTW
ncbi:hypothetical protein JAO73_09965 [Hymenobacter sp. BT523]|uniref:hypothetical protein n=1 Tax=Hymenobacter sp. BT523 TaxID=2795725 RepID=UPI0018EA3B30|nr:hypothetical protein [Hymenobacter sp. BT523]MBJ6109339.1 hypothetical protein [Hymenobacter sp. BT523]